MVKFNTMSDKKTTTYPLKSNFAFAIIAILSVGLLLYTTIEVYNCKQDINQINNEIQKLSIVEKSNVGVKDKKDELVWYEVPELGIKFKVSPDSKEDLRYFIKDYSDDLGKSVHVSFYSKFVRKNELDKIYYDIIFDTYNKKEYVLQDLVFTLESKKAVETTHGIGYVHRCDTVFLDLGNELICIPQPQATLFVSDTELGRKNEEKILMDKFKELNKDKKYFNIEFGTMTQI